MYQEVLQVGMVNYGNQMEYLVTNSNKLVYQALSSWKRSWGHLPYPNFLLVVGPKSSGKTSLAKFWQSISNATMLNNSFEIDYGIFESSQNFIIDDVHKINEHKLLHIFNLIRECNKLCLMTSVWPLKFKIPDLYSRIKAVRTVKVAIPDYDLIHGVISQQFRNRSIKIHESAIKYLCCNLSYNLSHIIKAISMVDKSSLSEHTNITIPFIKKALRDLHKPYERI